MHYNQIDMPYSYAYAYNQIDAYDMPYSYALQSDRHAI